MNHLDQPTLELAYAEACAGQSDMREHCPVLRTLAGLCRHVTEFGLRDGVSTVALLAGLVPVGGSMVSYDVQDCPRTTQCLQGLVGDRWRFALGDSRKVTIEPTDLLMIDTTHNYAVLSEELRRHVANVSRFIVLHDTTEFGHRGDNKGDGLLLAIGEFLVMNTRWHVQSHYPNCHGLTVLVRTRYGLSLLDKEGNGGE